MIDQSNPLIMDSVPFLQLNKEYKKNLESLPAGRQGYAWFVAKHRLRRSRQLIRLTLGQKRPTIVMIYY